MKKRITLWLLATLFLANVSLADAQQTGKVFRIGFLDTSTASGSAVLLEAFRQELSKLGWIEGKNITIEYRFAEQKNERLPELAADLVRLKVDLIVTSGATDAVSGEESNHYHPHRDDELSGPRGCRFGCQSGAAGRQCHRALEFSARAKYQKARDTQGRGPQARPSWASAVAGRRASRPDLQLKELRPAALALKLKLEEIETQLDAKGLESAFQTAKQKQVGAIMTTTGRRFFAERKRIVELAGKYRLPAIYSQKEFVDEGGLMSYGVDYDDLYRRAAVYVDKILKGAKPADLPVQQATKFEFVINLKAAKQIGLTLSPEFLSRANKVIKGEGASVKRL